MQSSPETTIQYYRTSFEILPVVKTIDFADISSDKVFHELLPVISEKDNSLGILLHADIIHNLLRYNPRDLRFKPHEHQEHINVLRNFFDINTFIDITRIGFFGYLLRIPVFSDYHLSKEYRYITHSIVVVKNMQPLPDNMLSTKPIEQQKPGPKLETVA